MYLSHIIIEIERVLIGPFSSSLYIQKTIFSIESTTKEEWPCILSSIPLF